MSHHGREDERDEPCGAQCLHTAGRARSAVELIQRIAVGEVDPGWCAENAQLWANQWLQKEGLESGPKLLARRRREARAAEIDDEIARLRAEKAKL